MKVIGVIPARYASLRFPGKPLALLAGKPLVEHVLAAARAAGRLDEVRVATDDERIAEAVHRAGGVAQMTSPEAKSGTDRVAEVARSFPADLYVNIQGDEPMMSPRNIDRAVETLLAAPDRQIATLVFPLPAAEAADPNVVKVAVSQEGRALYFSRAPIPYYRNGEPAYRKHLGIYAYRAKTLQRLAALSPSRLERAESLEQLRWLEAGYSIWAGEAMEDSFGIDTPEDLARTERLWKKEFVP